MSQFEYNLVDKFYQLYHKSLDDSIFILAYFQKKKKNYIRWSLKLQVIIHIFFLSRYQKFELFALLIVELKNTKDKINFFPLKLVTKKLFIYIYFFFFCLFRLAGKQNVFEKIIII